MTTFVAKFDSRGPCPRCRQPLRTGEELKYKSRRWPFDQEYVSPLTDLVIWHSTCVREALRDGLCPWCTYLHPDHEGSCLL